MFLCAQETLFIALAVFFQCTYNMELKKHYRREFYLKLYLCKTAKAKPAAAWADSYGNLIALRDFARYEKGLQSFAGKSRAKCSPLLVGNFRPIFGRHHSSSDREKFAALRRRMNEGFDEGNGQHIEPHFPHPRAWSICPIFPLLCLTVLRENSEIESPILLQSDTLLMEPESGAGLSLIVSHAVKWVRSFVALKGDFLLSPPPLNNLLSGEGIF